MAFQDPLVQITPDCAARPQPQIRRVKKLWRRQSRDWSQPLRRGVQGLFLLLNVFLGLQFFLFVRSIELAQGILVVSRPPGVEGWLPIAGLMQLRHFLLTGTVYPVHPAAFFLLVSFLVISFLFRKAFCGWLCPIGTISEALWKWGRKVLRKNWQLPRWFDIPLRSLKYLLLGFFAYAVGGMSAAAIRGFLGSPYGLVADVKMLNFFRYLSTSAAITLLALGVLSIIYQNFWCRYLCPYGALMGLSSLLSPMRIRRNTDRCIDCAKCAKACPSILPVDTLVTVASAECTGCFECVAVCPADGALQMSLPGKLRLPAWAFAAGAAIVFGVIVGCAKYANVWDSGISRQVYQTLVPSIQSFSHP